MKFFFRLSQMIFLLSFTLSASAVQSYATFNENDPVNNRTAFLIQQNHISTQRQPFLYSAPYNYGEQINYGVFDPNHSFRYRILKNGAQINSVSDSFSPLILMRTNEMKYLQDSHEYSNANDPYANIFIDRSMIRLSDYERKPTRSMVNCGRDHSSPLSHTEKILSSSQCSDFDHDFTVVYPIAKSLIPITNMLLLADYKLKIKTCEVELNTTKNWAFSSWYSTFITKGDCQIKLKLICDGSENSCSPSVGDYSTKNQFKLIIYDDEKNHKKESIKRLQNIEKSNVPHRPINLESINNMMFENKGSGTAKISYITSSCYHSTGPSSFYVNSGTFYLINIKTSNAYHGIRWWNCWNEAKTISWKIEYTTYE
ncbi:hypothetical protein PXH59_06665 [Xenorhabdus sp. SF857]|uniref:hypothetical protein n=1 Tax=Xenorhabdus bakwenae TaxID=3026967 RepID=UPI002557DB7B|nr:hypothetical protein [Xenorhabdus sp. SF857]WFQ80785.1 hypothetical protein PXH59_06665 [Xenorhabdus sp. SF857]